MTATILLAIIGCDNTPATDCTTCTLPSDTDTGAAAEDTSSWLMFQDARGVRFDFDATIEADCAAVDGLWSGDMTLLTVDALTLWFTDTPEHTTFNMATEDFVAQFAGLFPDAPPNAVVSWDETNESEQHVVVELSQPTLDGSDLIYTACALPLSDPETLQPLPNQYVPPQQPAHVGTVAVFIDNAEVDPSTLTDAQTPDEDTPRPVYLAVSGGGWHTHTATAGWLSGMLDKSGGTLEDIMQHVVAISSNSGGSWFIGQLAYSPSFRNALENERNDWLTTGYIGQTAALFDSGHPCKGWTGLNWELCRNASWTREYYQMMNLADSSSLNWQIFVENVVYAPFDMSTELAGVTLGSPRQTWADGRDLIIAASLMTDTVVLNEDASGSFSSWVQSVDLAPTDGRPTQNFAPLFFSSVDTGRTAPDLLGMGSLDGSWESSWPTSTASDDAISGTNSHISAVPVIDATVASSAAPAAVASERAAAEGGMSALSSTVSYVAADLAPPILLTDSGIDFVTTIANYTGDDESTSTAGLAASGAVRVADGGYLDNTSVAYLLQHLTNNNLLVDDTEVVLFMNSSSKGVGAGSQTIPESVAVLFGYDPGTERYTEPAADKAIKFCDDFCVSTYSAHLFEKAVWMEAEPSWSYAKDDVALRYFSLSVKTVDNTIFDIAAGTTVNLHLFISEDFQSSALPSTQAIVDSYSDVFTITRAGVAEESGWGYLASAFQLQ